MVRQIPDRAAIDADFVLESEVGVANGVASLDETGKVPAAQLPTSEISGALVYRGVWNASTNTPSLADGTGDKGDYYVVSVAGSTSLDGIADWQAGDWAVFNGTVWEKADHSDLVSSVAGKTGAVTLDADDIDDAATAHRFATAAQLTKLDGVEASADVTDATNVAAAGAVMDGDFSSNGLMKRTGAAAYATAVAGTDYEPANADIVKTDESDEFTVGHQDRVVDGGNTGAGTVTLTFAAGNLQNRTMTGSFTLAVPSGEGVIILRLKIDGTGGYTMTASGWDKVIGTLNTAANKTNLLTLFVDSAESVLVIAAEA